MRRHIHTLRFDHFAPIFVLVLMCLRLHSSPSDKIQSPPGGTKRSSSCCDMFHHHRFVCEYLYKTRCGTQKNVIIDGLRPNKKASWVERAARVLWYRVEPLFSLLTHISPANCVVGMLPFLHFILLKENFLCCVCLALLCFSRSWPTPVSGGVIGAA